MECPHCHGEIPGEACPQCGEMAPLNSRYCMACGTHLETESNDIMDQDDGLDLENRVLCSDGACTGIIINGKCTECGKPP